MADGFSHARLWNSYQIKIVRSAAKATVRSCPRINRLAGLILESPENKAVRWSWSIIF